MNAVSLRAVRLLATVAVVATLAACGGGSSGGEVSDGTGSASTTNGGARARSFTDDLGNTIDLPDRRLRVAAHSVSAGGLWEYGIRPVAVFGPQQRAGGAEASAIGEADPDSWETVGDALGTINLEALAATRPDVIVTGAWDADGLLWGVEKEQEAEVRTIAPVVAIRVDNRSLTKTLARYADVAEALGADLQSKPVHAAKQRFDDASEHLRQSAAANPDVRIGGVSADSGHIYIAVPKAWTDLHYYRSLGVNLLTPDESEEFWATLSWEEARRYPVDLVLADNRGGDIAAVLKAFPASERLVPAIAQGQIASWEMETAFGYSNFARVMRNLARAIDDASVIPQ